MPAFTTRKLTVSEKFILRQIRDLVEKFGYFEEVVIQAYRVDKNIYIAFLREDILLIINKKTMESCLEIDPDFINEMKNKIKTEPEIKKIFDNLEDVDSATGKCSIKL